MPRMGDLKTPPAILPHQTGAQGTSRRFAIEPHSYTHGPTCSPTHFSHRLYLADK